MQPAELPPAHRRDGTIWLFQMPSACGTILDDAVRLNADLDEAVEIPRARARPALIWPTTSQRRATTRDFRIQTGNPDGAGLLQLIDSRSWRDDADLAQVYTAWGRITAMAHEKRTKTRCA